MISFGGISVDMVHSPFLLYKYINRKCISNLLIFIWKVFYLEDILQAKLNLLAMLFFHNPVQEYIFFRTLINIIFIIKLYIFSSIIIHHHNIGFYWNFHLVSSLKESSGSTSTLLLLKIPSTSFLNLQKIFFCSTGAEFLASWRSCTPTD